MQGTERTLLPVSTVKTHTAFLDTGMNFKDASNQTSSRLFFLFLSHYLNPHLRFKTPPVVLNAHALVCFPYFRRLLCSELHVGAALQHPSTEPNRPPPPCRCLQQEPVDGPLSQRLHAERRGETGPAAETALQVGTAGGSLWRKTDIYLPQDRGSTLKLGFENGQQGAPPRVNAAINHSLQTTK